MKFDHNAVSCFSLGQRARAKHHLPQEGATRASLLAEGDFCAGSSVLPA